MTQNCQVCGGIFRYELGGFGGVCNMCERTAERTASEEPLKKESPSDQRRLLARRLRRIVKTHEEKHGPTLPTTDAPGWVAARDILTDLAALVEELR
tara:strand:+ start:1423 stop:1713 length:291 start_codon:yes stop_codon:yes gene_type:complete